MSKLNFLSMYDCSVMFLMDIKQYNNLFLITLQVSNLRMHLELSFD
jgi:hypothetical protein